MKILFISNINHHQYINYHAKWLKKSLGASTTIDLFSTHPLDLKNKTVRFNFDSIFFAYKNSLFSKIPGFKRLIFMPLSFLKLRNDYDIIQIHFIFPFLNKIAPYFHKKAKVVISSLWGSDFYKMTPTNQKKKETVLFRFSDAITLGNPEMITDFNKKFPANQKPVHLCYFGVETIDRVKDIKSSNNKLSKIILGLNPDKITITIGYNASENQQHLAIINSIKNNSALSEFSKQIEFVFPLTYGGSSQYQEAIIRELKQLHFNYLYFDSFLDNEKVAHLRLATDIMINLPVSDALSGSLREHIFAENLIITGNWLPYSTLKNNQIYFIGIHQLTDLPQTIYSSLKHWTNEKNKVIGNAEKIWQISSWNVVINEWTALYRSFVSKSQN